MFPLPFRQPLAAFVSVTLALASLSFADVDVIKEADKVRVEIDGHLFTEYHFTNTRRPYLYPIIGPTGGTMTRHWPLENDLPNEAQDHPHHKGLWYGHRNVNGVEFWGDILQPSETGGQMIHDGFLEITGGKQQGSLRAKNKWVVDKTGEVVCTDERTLHFIKDPNGPMIDFDITIKAGDKDVVFGDDKDGVMSIRVPESMRVELPRPKGAKVTPKGEGHIVTSEGKQDGAAWGTRANWCDYYGPDEGKTAGVAMFDHPSNPRHPTWWHVRTYGLFSANPFGQAMFEKLPEKNAGDFTIPAGQSTTFRYRFYFHPGDTENAKVAEHYTAYVSAAK